MFHVEHSDVFRRDLPFRKAQQLRELRSNWAFCGISRVDELPKKYAAPLELLCRAHIAQPAHSASAQLVPDTPAAFFRAGSIPSLIERRTMVGGDTVCPGTTTSAHER